MRLAITADAHLRSYESTPERFEALQDIFEQASSDSIDTVLVCGDLFDKDYSNYSEFENLVRHFSNLSIWIIPGNHDYQLSSNSLIGKNIRIFEKVEILNLGLSLLIIPYKKDLTMGEIIARWQHVIEPNKWVLCSHGDYLDGPKIVNQLEYGTYMPLTKFDIDRFQPARVFLGHIHQKMDGTIIMPGSPCGIDISETGLRSFIVFDSETGHVTRKSVMKGPIFQQTTLLILPLEDEVSYVKRLIAETKSKWTISKADIPRTRIRVNVQGYSQSKSELYGLIKDGFKEFQFYRGEEPNLDFVSTVKDFNKSRIAECVMKKMENLNLRKSIYEPDKSSILYEALKIIYED